MDAIEAIVKRRSIRRFTPGEVTREELHELLKAGMYAPSAGNERPWEFVVVTERSLLDGITAVHPHAAMLRQAPLAIMVCADLTRQKYEGYWVQDCSAATQNILLAATAMGLGSVWLGVYPLEERIAGLRRLFGLPEHIVPLSIVAVGRPAETIAQPERYDETRVHSNRW